MLRRCLTAFALTAVALACSPDAPPDGAHDVRADNDWTQANELAGKLGLGLVRGHEDLTRFAVEQANALMKVRDGVKAFPYLTVPIGDYGYASKNPLVEGDFAADFAVEMWPFQDHRFDEVLAFYHSRANSVSEWQDAPDLQSIHFLRDFRDGTAVSAAEACHAGRQRVIDATQQALKIMMNDYFHSQFWIGLALHTLQDSFSPAHVRRVSRGTQGGENDFKWITDVCTYGKQAFGACKHPEPIMSLLDTDRIWKSGTLLDFNRPREDLIPAAEAAVKAGAGYLVTVEEYYERKLRGADVDIEAELTRMFDTEVDAPDAPGSLHDYTGFFRCPE